MTSHTGKRNYNFHSTATAFSYSLGSSMRCLLLPLLMLSGSTAFVAPVAPARPQHVVRAEKEGEAVAKKKGIPLALLIWPLIAVGDDVGGRVDKSTRVVRHRRARETTHRPQTRRSTSRKSSRASRSRASRRPRCRTRTRTTSRSKFCSLLLFLGLRGVGYDIAPKKSFNC